MDDLFHEATQNLHCLSPGPTAFHSPLLGLSQLFRFPARSNMLKFHAIHLCTYDMKMHAISDTKRRLRCVWRNEIRLPLVEQKRFFTYWLQGRHVHNVIQLLAMSIPRQETLPAFIGATASSYFLAHVLSEMMSFKFILGRLLLAMSYC